MYVLYITVLKGEKMSSFHIKSMIHIFLSITFLCNIYAENVSNTPEGLNFNLVENTGEVGNTGDLSLNFPLLTIPGRNGLDYTIYLNYESSIKTLQIASWTGLGFNLQTGSVTRSVVNRIDEQQPKMFNRNPQGDAAFNLDNQYFDGNGSNPYDNGSIDPNAYDEEGGFMAKYLPLSYIENAHLKEDWDQYFVHFTQGSYRLIPHDYLGIDGTHYGFSFYTEQWKPWDINCRVLYNGPILDSFIDDFQLIQTDRNVYSYDHPCYIELKNELSLEGKRHIKFPVRWDLTQVVSPNYNDINSNGPDDTDTGDWIKITYNDYAHSKYNSTSLDFSNISNIGLGPEDTYGWTNKRGTTPSGPYNYTNLYYDYSCVQTIETPTHIAIFYTSDRDDYIPANSSTAGKPKKLDSIVLYSKTNNQRVKKIVFTYATDLNSARNSAETSYAWAENEKLKDDCLTLIKVQEFGRTDSDTRPPYQFEYTDNPNPYGGNYYVGNDMGYWVGNSKVWSLNKVVFPEGGYVEYEYNNDQYKWYYSPFEWVYSSTAEPNEAGTRLISKTVYDGMGNWTKHNYSYGEGIREMYGSNTSHFKVEAS